MAEIYRKPPVRTSNDRKNDSKKKKSKPVGKPKAKKLKPKKTQFRKEVYKIIGQTKSPLSAFVARPKKVNFETQLKGEEIILLLRRHLITQISWLVVLALMFIAPISLTNFPIIDFLPARFQFIVILMWYLLVMAFALERFLGWYFNVYIITDERIIDVDFCNLIYKEISSAEIENIEDVTMIMGGVIQTIFNYGLINIQTAAEVPQLEFEDVPNPALVVQVLKRMQLEEKQEIIEGRVR